LVVAALAVAVRVGGERVAYWAAGGTRGLAAVVGADRAVVGWRGAAVLVTVGVAGLG